MKLHKILEIVDESDSDSTSCNSDDTAYIIPSAMRARVIKWVNDHKYAREAIIHYLSDIELLKLKDVEESASEIWKCLHDEYDKSFNLEYIHASNNLTNLKKKNKTSINNHINHFEQLIYDINYNKSINTTNMKQLMINFKFLNILMIDKLIIDKWETFINAKDSQLEQMSIQQLYAKVRVNAANVKLAKPSSFSFNKAWVLIITELQQVIQAFNIWIDIFQHGNDNNDHGRGNWRDREDDRKSTHNDYNNDNHGGEWGDKKSKLSYDSNKYCERHNKWEYNTENCLLLKKENHETITNNQHVNNTNHQSNYQSNFNHLQQYNIKTTRLIINNTKIQYINDSQDWIIDFIANVYITSFKEYLYNYHEYSNQGI